MEKETWGDSILDSKSLKLYFEEIALSSECLIIIVWKLLYFQGMTLAGITKINEVNNL